MRTLQAHQKRQDNRCPLPESGNPVREESRPAGRMLNWVCRDDTDYLDLSRHQEELTPAPQPGHPKKSTAPDEIIESHLIPREHCGELAALTHEIKNI